MTISRHIGFLFTILFLSTSISIFTPVIANERISALDPTQIVKKIYKLSEKDQIDEIYMLLAFATVHKDWQDEDLSRSRGHNIGSILVKNPENEPVFWARNANRITRNGSQHGEVRLIHNYLNCPNNRRYRDEFLERYTVYTTLEPCAMCTGMMSLTRLERVVYGQKDLRYGGVLALLKADTSSIKGGRKKYPISPRAFSKSKSVFTDELENLFDPNGDINITAFLRSDEAKDVFARAEEILVDKLDRKKLRFPQSRDALDRAKVFLRDKVTNKYLADFESICPSPT